VIGSQPGKPRQGTRRQWEERAKGKVFDMRQLSQAPYNKHSIVVQIGGKHV
jgi:hypothetical protein